MFGYAITPQRYYENMIAPQDQGIGFFFNIAWIGFALTTDLVVESWCVCQERSEGVKTTKSQLALRFGIAAIRKMLTQLFDFLLDIFVFRPLFDLNRKQTRALAGDIKYEYSEDFFDKTEI